MRLWHWKMIPALPREQLVAQWRELSAIAGNIKEKQTPNHILVNPITTYPMDYFATYAAAVREEMTKRKYRTMDSVWKKITDVCGDYKIVPLSEIYKDWMDDEYLTICYYNLREKWLRGGIKDEDWDKIKKLYKI